jgi:hypothetical protein
MADAVRADPAVIQPMPLVGKKTRAVRCKLVLAEAKTESSEPPAFGPTAVNLRMVRLFYLVGCFCPNRHLGIVKILSFTNS